jgi:hypothetical protein
MTMKRSIVLTILIIPSLSLSLSGTALGDRHSEHGGMMGEQAAAAKEPKLKTQDDLAKEIKALRERLAALEALKPTFTNFMPDFAERFHVMHRAGDAGDWAVAAHEAEEMERLTRASRYIDPKLGAVMQGFMDGNLRNLSAAIKMANAGSFQAALKDTVASCNGCHQASGSTIAVSLNVDESLSMRHPHVLSKTTVPKNQMH